MDMQCWRILQVNAMISLTLNVQMRVDQIEIVSHVKECATEISGEINIFLYIFQYLVVMVSFH